MKELFLLRGLPGSGKSTLAKSIGGTWVEADHYFLNENGDYEFDASKLKEAHRYCQNYVEDSMKFYIGLEDTFISPSRILVSNTFTQEWEMQPYFDLAEKYGYRVYSLIVDGIGLFTAFLLYQQYKYLLYALILSHLQALV